MLYASESSAREWAQILSKPSECPRWAVFAPNFGKWTVIAAWTESRAKEVAKNWR
jgi:hypothetical protein